MRDESSTQLVVRRAERRRDQTRVLVLRRSIVEAHGVGVEPGERRR